jgi:hypothetical protein
MPFLVWMLAWMFARMLLLRGVGMRGTKTLWMGFNKISSLAQQPTSRASALNPAQSQTPG